MDLNAGLNQIEAMRKQLMGKLTSAEKQQVDRAIGRMSKATTPEELTELHNKELENLKNGN